MKSYVVRLGLAVVLFLGMTASPECGIAQVFGPGYGHPSRNSCAPQQRVQPATRNVTVTVPVNPAPVPCGVPLCGPVPYCPPSRAATPPRPMPVRVDIAVRPESCDQGRMVPVVYRDPGFLAPIIGHTVGLIGATIAAPFRVAEMLCPVGPPACAPRRPCGPPACASPSPCPPPLCMPPAPCRQAMACAPPGPSVAPMPPCAMPRPCDPNLPPALIAEYRFPQCEPQNLLSGICNFPARLRDRGRLTGDIGGPMHGPCQ